MSVNKSMIAVTVVVFAALISGSRAFAIDMAYDQTMTGSGNLNGVSFSNATITFELDGDTADITHPFSSVDSLAGTGTVTVQGFATATITDSAYHVFTNTSGFNGSAGGFSGSGGDYDDLISSSLANYNLVGAFGPITAPGNVSAPLGTGDIPTSLGILDISSAGSTETFAATVVPEPSSIGMVTIGGIGLLARRRHRPRSVAR
jgi:hypothetical protein